MEAHDRHKISSKKRISRANFRSQTLCFVRLSWSLRRSKFSFRSVIDGREPRIKTKNRNDNKPTTASATFTITSLRTKCQFTFDYSSFRFLLSFRRCDSTLLSPYEFLGRSFLCFACDFNFCFFVFSLIAGCGACSINSFFWKHFACDDDDFAVYSQRHS